MRILLDTCTFLWIAANARELSDRARDFFSDPGNEVFLSPVSAWEIVVKHSIGRLPLPRPPHEFVPEERRRHRISSIGLNEEAVLQLAKLPDHHRDPFDRMLICQAVAQGLTIMTPDPAIARYPVPIAW